MGDHRGGGPQTQGSLGPPPSCDASALSALISYSDPPSSLPPPIRRPTPSYGGKLRPRPLSKFPGPSQLWGCPHPQLPAATWTKASRRPGRGIPRAQAAFQPATSASDLSAARSQHRDSSLPGVTQQVHRNLSALAATEPSLPRAVGRPLPKSRLK